MAKKSPDQIAAKYQRGVTGAGQDYADGVTNPARSWSTATQAASGRWANGVQAAIQNRTFATGVQKAGDTKWQSAALNKGAARYTAAAPEAAQAYAAKAGLVMQAASAAQSAVQAMPTDTLEQRIARSAAAQRAISAAWNGGKPKA